VFSALFVIGLFYSLSLTGGSAVVQF